MGLNGHAQKANQARMRSTKGSCEIAKISRMIKYSSVIPKADAVCGRVSS